MLRLATIATVALLVTGCGRAPSPLAPSMSGSIGVPHRGILEGGKELPAEGDGYKWLRNDDRHYGLPRFVATIERAAKAVARERPGSVLAVGDLSTTRGGMLMPHFSHRTGRDADLLFYLLTPEGTPVESPGFIHVGRDGLAWDEKGKRFLRLDVERQWLLVKALVEDSEARVQWIFTGRDVRALLLEWARARGERPDTIVRAMEVMLQPSPGGPHDDHVHVRTACTPAEMAAGCEHTGPRREWLEAASSAQADATDDVELALELLAPLAADGGRVNASASN
jgi:penicillin-insensitive murein endopeptidase